MTLTDSNVNRTADAAHHPVGAAPDTRTVGQAHIHLWPGSAEPRRKMVSGAGPVRDLKVLLRTSFGGSTYRQRLVARRVAGLLDEVAE